MHEARKLRAEGKRGAPRILGFTAALLILLGMFFARTVPSEVGISFTKALIGVFIFACLMVLYVYVLGPLIVSHSKYRYKISESGVAADSPRFWFVGWKKIQGYSLSQHSELPEVMVIMIRTQGLTKSLYLPEGEVADAIIATFAGRVPLIENTTEPGQTFELTKLQWAYLYLVTITYAIFGAYFLVLTNLRKVPHFVFFVPIVLGPGSLALLSLFGKRLLKDNFLKVYALAFNVLGVSLIMLLSALLLFYQFSKEMSQ
jgi:hypothetical protein